MAEVEVGTVDESCSNHCVDGRIDCMGGIGVWEWGWDTTGGC